MKRIVRLERGHCVQTPCVSTPRDGMPASLGGVEVVFRSLSVGAPGVAGFFQGGDAGVGGGGELAECVLAVGADAGGLVGCGGVGVLGPDGDGGSARRSQVASCSAPSGRA